MTNGNLDREEKLAKLERELISDLREEAAEAKKCFTTFSFQSIAFSSAIIGFIFKTIPDNPISALAAIPGISFLMIVCRIGIYKYQTANRAYGYQFYLEQTDTYRDKNLIIKSNSYQLDKKEDNNDFNGYGRESETRRAWELIIENRSWEQVFRVWRIIHPTIFKRIYVTPEQTKKSRLSWLLNVWNSICPRMYRHTDYVDDQISKATSESNDEDIYLWCFLEYIAAKKINIAGRTKQMYSKYKSGTYLKNMLMILFILQIIFLFCMLLANIVLIDKVISTKATMGEVFLGINLFLPVSFIVMLVLTVFRIVRTDKRRNIIENELYSIHSCEITWQIVTLAHYRATQESRKSPSHQQSNNQNWFYLDKIYLESISNESEKIINNLFSLDKWIEKADELSSTDSDSTQIPT